MAKPQAAKTTEKPRGFDLSPDMIGKPVSADSIEIQPRRVSQKYVPILNLILGLKIGQAVQIKKPDGVEFDRFRASIATTLKKRTEGKIKGRLSFNKSKDGALVVSLVSAKD